MDQNLTLPGDIPGLLRRGAPVVVRLGHTTTTVRGVVVLEGGSVFDIWEVWSGGDDGEMTDVQLRQVSLDLSDEAGRDRAARWLAERLGLVAGATAPRWVQYYLDPKDPVGAAWRPYRPATDMVIYELTTAAGLLGHQFFAKPLPADWRMTERRHVVPALADIDPTDPLADVRALVAVCLHVAGRS